MITSKVLKDFSRCDINLKIYTVFKGARESIMLCV